MYISGQDTIFKGVKNKIETFTVVARYKTYISLPFCTGWVIFIFCIFTFLFLFCFFDSKKKVISNTNKNEFRKKQKLKVIKKNISTIFTFRCAVVRGTLYPGKSKYY